MATNARFSVTTATNDDRTALPPKRKDGDEIPLENTKSMKNGDNFRYHSPTMTELYQPAVHKLLHSDSLVEKAHNILPTSSFDLKAMTKK